MISPPHPLAPARASSPRWVAVVNLLNSIVGAGILSLPYAFRECGYAAGALMQLAFGLTTYYGIRPRSQTVGPLSPLSPSHGLFRG